MKFIKIVKRMEKYVIFFAIIAKLLLDLNDWKFVTT